MKKGVVGIFLFGIFLIGFVSSANIYIDPTYSGTESGTFAQPYNSWNDFTITAGNDYRQKCGTTTTFSSSLTISAIGTSSNSIILGSYYESGGNPVHEDLIPSFGKFCGNNVEKPIIKDADNTYPRDVTLFRTANSGSQYLEFNSLQIIDSHNMIYINSGENIVRYCYLDFVEWGVRIGLPASEGANNNLIEYNFFDQKDILDEDNIGFDPVNLNSNSHYNVIQYNHFTGYDHIGIQLTRSSNNLIQYNYFYGTNGHEDVCWNTNYNCDSNIFRYNFCKNSGGFQIMGGTNGEVYGNIITCGSPSWTYDNRGCIHLQAYASDGGTDYPTSGNTIYGNTIYLANEDYDGSGYRAFSYSRPGTIEDNIFANNIIRSVGQNCITVLDYTDTVGINYFYHNSCFDYVGNYARIENSHLDFNELNSESYAFGNIEGDQGLNNLVSYELWPLDSGSSVVGTGINLVQEFGIEYSNQILNPVGTDFTAEPPKVVLTTQPENWYIGAFALASGIGYCGDGTCNNGETCSTCPGDCTTGCSTNFFPNQLVEAEDGVIVSPVAIRTDSLASGGEYVSTNTANSGSVSYTFDILEAGNYLIEARIIAPNTGSDSFFVGLDSEAASENDIYAWDTIEPTSWTWVNVSKRGTGDSFVNEFDPMIWNLSTGGHTFTFYGRESGTLLDRIILKKVVSDSHSNCGSADSNTDGQISISELLNYISNWKNGSVVISQLLNAISEWKSGC